RLDDAAVDPHHAVLYFQNGKAAVQDSGSVGGLYVNGHQVTACEIRSVDEVVLGPFVLKTRVLGPRTTPKATPPPEVSALLGSVPPAGIPHVAPISSPRRNSAPPPPPAEPDATVTHPLHQRPAPTSPRGAGPHGPRPQNRGHDRNRTAEGPGPAPLGARREGKAPAPRGRAARPAPLPPPRGPIPATRLLRAQGPAAAPAGRA